MVWRSARWASKSSAARRKDNHRRRHRETRRVVESLERRDLMAADPMVFDSNDTSWYSYRDLTSTEWSDVFAQRKADYIPVDIEVAEVSGSARIGGLWQANTDGRGWALWRNLS